MFAYLVKQNIRDYVQKVAKAKFKSSICQRIAHVRRELYGDRGKASFAKNLGISPSTYNYYETTRVPPAEILVKIADVAGVDLRWLFTGELSAKAVPGDHPVVQRMFKLLAAHPDAAEPLGAFVDLLAKTFRWPEKALFSEQPQAAAAPPARAEAQGSAVSIEPGPTLTPTPAQPRQDWIPVLGRSAAGVPQFWKDRADGAGVAALEELVDRYARRAARQVQPATAAEQAGAQLGPAQIITLTAPDAGSVAEFIVAGTLKRRYPDAFAVRIDGDSMAPEIRHGDLVVCSASAAAADGAPAVVQLEGQIGVTCKIFRSAAQTVHLVPINEQYAPQSFPAERMVWARRVLARVRALAKP